MGAGYGTTAKNLARDSGLDLVPSAPVTYGAQGLAPYAGFSSGGYLLIIGGNDSTYSPAGAFTVGGWFYATSGALGQTLISSYKETDRGWRLLLYSNSQAEFLVSNNGSTFNQWHPAGANISLGAWHFITARYTPGAEQALWVDNAKFATTTSIYASLHTAAASLAIGAQADGGNPLNGRASLCFFCETALSDIYLTALYQMTRPLFQ